jgi:Tol biopolymer transport system component
VGAPDSANPLGPTMSPDGRRLVLHRVFDGNGDVWLLDIGRAILSRLTLNGAQDIFGTWSPDGRRMLFASNRKGAYDLYLTSAAGGGAEELVVESEASKIPTDWRREYVLFNLNGSISNDIWGVAVDGDRKPFAVVATAFEERDAQFSPDGQWIAYQSNESGRFEVYVQAFPGPGGRLQLSSDGGAQARWRADGRELFYVALDGRLMAVPIGFGSSGETVEPGTPIPLFSTTIGGAVQ